MILLTSVTEKEEETVPIATSMEFLRREKFTDTQRNSCTDRPGRRLKKRSVCIDETIFNAWISLENVKFLEFLMLVIISFEVL
jgi:hypothetical protein